VPIWCVEMNEGNSVGATYNRLTGCSAEKAPHATFKFNFKTKGKLCGRDSSVVYKVICLLFVVLCITALLCYCINKAEVTIRIQFLKYTV